ncbi:hypothetical protein ABXS75_10740 [Roseburia hominis]
MKKYMRNIFIVMLVLFAAMGMKVQAADDDAITLIFPKDIHEVERITSLKFSMEVQNISDTAKISMKFVERDKTIQKTTYDAKKKVLTVYIAGETELIGEDHQLKIGNLKVKMDGNHSENITVKLDQSSMQFVNGANELMESSYWGPDAIKLSGKGVIETDENPPEEGDDSEDATLAKMREALQKLIEKCEALAGSEDKYTEASWNEFEEALKLSREVCGNEKATLEEIQVAMSSLAEAFNGLESVSDDLETARESLKHKLEELNALLSSDYTEESWNQLYELMVEAQKMLDEDASKEEIDAMLDKLRKAQRGLVKVEIQESTDKDTSGTTSDKKSDRVKSGDESHLVFWIILAVLALTSAGTVICIRKMKKQQY